MNKNPDLQFKYARGMGDIIACILHSKIFGWLTFKITGKKEPCKTCSVRRNALNIIFPIPFWRLFFKDKEQMILSIKNSYEKNGYNFNFDESNQTSLAFKGTTENLPIIPKTVINETEVNNKNNIKNYICISDSDTHSGDLLIKVQIFKKII
jgi:hypothetical protein